MDNEIHNNQPDEEWGSTPFMVTGHTLPFAQISTYVYRDPRLSSDAKACYGYLATYRNFNRDNKVWPSQKTIAEHMAWGANKPRKLLRELEDYGLIGITTTLTKNGKVTAYELFDFAAGSEAAIGMFGSSEAFSKRTHEKAEKKANRTANLSIKAQESFPQSEENPRSEPSHQFGGMGFPQSEVFHNDFQNPRSEPSHQFGACHQIGGWGTHQFGGMNNNKGNNNDIDIEGEHEDEVFVENQETALSAEEEAAFKGFASKLRKPIRRSSIEEVKADYRARLDEGYSPEDIQAAYEAYIADHRRKNNGDPAIQYIMSAHAFLTEGKGLVAYSSATVNERPKRVDAERASVSTLRAHASNDEVISGLFDSWQRKCYLLSNAGKSMSDEARRRTADAAKGDERSIRNRYAELQSRGKVR